MASRVVNRLGSGTLRPIGSRLTPALSYVPARSASNTTPATQPDPKTRAQAIIDALPGSSIVSKTAILSAGAGLSLAAISSELYVVNEESIVAFSLLSIFFAVGKYGGPMYADWAKGQIQKVKGILEASRARHSDSVQQRIDSFKELEGVVDLTKSLFALSKVSLADKMTRCNQEC